MTGLAARVKAIFGLAAAAGLSAAVALPCRFTLGGQWSG